MIHWANATHACTCEVDIETGHVTLTRYIVSEDVGPMINPNVVEGQIAGGTVQGIGGALLENIVYDDDGNPLSSTFVDYLLPTATEVPAIEYGHVEIPGPGVGGYKGVRRGRCDRFDARGDQRDQRRAGAARRDAHPTARQPRRDRRPDRTSRQQALERTTKVELNNEFRVAVPAAKTWEVLTDVERVAPCIPGAQLLSVDGDDFTGAVKVKVGPITVSYKGNASFQEKDAAAQRVVIKASGKETRGSGNAAAIVTAQLKDEGDATHCRHHHRPHHLGQGRAVRPRRARRRVDQPDRAVRQERLEADVLGGCHRLGTDRIGGRSRRRPRPPPQADAGDSDRPAESRCACRWPSGYAPVAAVSPPEWWSASCWAVAQAVHRRRRWPTICRPRWRGCCHEGRAVRLPPPDTSPRRRRCSPNSATTPRSWRAARVWCRCSRCG